MDDGPGGVSSEARVKKLYGRPGGRLQVPNFEDPVKPIQRPLSPDQPPYARPGIRPPASSFDGAVKPKERSLSPEQLPYGRPGVRHPIVPSFEDAVNPNQRPVSPDQLPYGSPPYGRSGGRLPIAPSFDAAVNPNQRPVSPDQPPYVRPGGRFPTSYDSAVQQNQRPVSPEQPPPLPCRGHRGVEEPKWQREPTIAREPERGRPMQSQPERPIPSRGGYPPMALPSNTTASGASFYPPLALSSMRAPVPPVADKAATDSRRQSLSWGEDYGSNIPKDEDLHPERRSSSGWPSAQDESSPPRPQRSNAIQQPIPCQQRPLSPPHPPPPTAPRSSPPQPSYMTQPRRQEALGPPQRGGTRLKPPPGSSRTPPAGWSPRPPAPPPDDFILPAAVVDTALDETAPGSRRTGMSWRTAPGGGFNRGESAPGGYPAQHRDGTMHREQGDRASAGDLDGVARRVSREGMAPYGYGGPPDGMEVALVGSPTRSEGGGYDFRREESIRSESTASEVSAGDWSEHRRFNKVSEHAQRYTKAILSSAGVAGSEEENDVGNLGSGRLEAVLPNRQRKVPMRGRWASMGDLKDFMGEEGVPSPAGGGPKEGEGLEQAFMRGMRLAGREETRRQRMQEQEKILADQLWPAPVIDPDEQPSQLGARGRDWGSVDVPPVRGQGGRGSGDYLDVPGGRGQAGRSSSYGGGGDMPVRQLSRDPEGSGKREGGVEQTGQQRGMGEGPANNGVGQQSGRTSATQALGMGDGKVKGTVDHNVERDHVVEKPVEAKPPPAPVSRPVPPPPTRHQPDLQELIANGAGEITVVFEMARAQKGRAGNRTHVPRFNDAVNQNIKPAPKWASLSDTPPTLQEADPPPPAPAPANHYQGVPAHVAAPPQPPPGKQKKKWYKFTKS